MDNYVTGEMIRELREKQGITQAELGEILGVSNKTVSKWENGKGLPDISLIKPLASALKVSVTEMMNGERVKNENVSANMLKSVFYVCPVCNNVIWANGECVVSCCGIELPPLAKEEDDGCHSVFIEKVEDEEFVTVKHEMTKEHYITFISLVTGDRVQTVRLYPEGNAETRFKRRGHGILYWYCNRHGLFYKRF